MPPREFAFLRVPGNPSLTAVSNHEVAVDVQNEDSVTSGNPILAHIGVRHLEDINRALKDALNLAVLANSEDIGLHQVDVALPLMVALIPGMLLEELQGHVLRRRNLHNLVVLGRVATGREPQNQDQGQQHHKNFFHITIHSQN